MKTKNFPFCIKSIIAFLLLLSSQSTFAQQHAIKITPLKLLFHRFELDYEFKSKNNLALNIAWQNWSKKNVKDRPTLFSISDYTTRSTHLGNRGIIEGRYYLVGKSSTEMYFGFGVFLGKHKVGNYHPPCCDILNGQNQGDSRSGEVDILSRGVLFDFGIRRVFNSRLVIDIGLMGGRSWANKNEDDLILVSTNPFASDIIGEFPTIVNKRFFEPRIAIGFGF